MPGVAGHDRPPPPLRAVRHVRSGDIAARITALLNERADRAGLGGVQGIAHGRPSRTSTPGS
ncbi:MAG: hypothetical protein ACRDQI_00825 [Pseudonocardiaceae bacterium]